MSLDLYLESDTPVTRRRGGGIFVWEGGRTVELTAAEWNARHPDSPVDPADTAEGEEYQTTELYHASITHNLNRMAREAGISTALWRPEEAGVRTAADLARVLRPGLEALRADPARFRAFDPPNKWGDYHGLVQFVEYVLAACEAHPEAAVRASV